MTDQTYTVQRAFTIHTKMYDKTSTVTFPKGKVVAQIVYDTLSPRQQKAYF